MPLQPGVPRVAAVLSLVSPVALCHNKRRAVTFLALFVAGDVVLST